VIPYSFIPDGPTKAPNARIRFGVEPTNLFVQPKAIVLGEFTTVKVFASQTTYFFFEILDSSINYTLTLLEGPKQPYSVQPVKMRFGANINTLPVAAESADFFSFDSTCRLFASLN